MGIIDNAKDMADKAKDKMDSTDMDDKAKAKIEQMRREKAEHQNDMDKPA